MLRLAWMTDPHLNFLDIDTRKEFCSSINNLKVDALLISGDIGEAVGIESYLRTLMENVEPPVYFVLGNHDYYRGSIADVRSRAARVCAESKRLIWLPQAGLIQITPDACLIGHDGWADGRFGNFLGSKVMLNDYRLIEELKGLTSAERLEKLHYLGDEAAEHFMKLLPRAVQKYKQVIVLTHVPPFREACWHEGEISNDDYLPHFSCKAVGEVLRKAMVGVEAQMLVLCGHSHSPGEARILPNLLVKTGKAVYGNPAVNEIITVPFDLA
ncbi:metallophosphoesterase family protein [Geomonas agri]|uniref:metallophosphoesterase family protein n=1 Tax=Geomonas agri TaxID=2873702 RepID=UPI001CD4231C|nr:metallophosphoesterase [Geomonas agri]